MAYNPNEPRDDRGRWGSGNEVLQNSELLKIEALADASRKGNFSVDEKDALRNYSSGSSEVNTALRKNYSMPTELRKTISLMDSAFQKSSLPHEIEVYRVISEDFFDKLRHKIGVPLIDRGFLSTTTSIASARNVADAFNNEHEGQQPDIKFKMMKLIVPKGHPAIPMTAYYSVYADDREVLLKRGTRFKLLDRNNIKVIG